MISIKKRARGRTEDDRPNPIDVHIGRRICQRRKLLHMSQEDLARQLKLTFQQIQKYEKGGNRVSGSRLWIISRVLQVPVDYFFSNMDPQTVDEGERLLADPEAVCRYSPQEDVTRSPDVLELVNAYINSRHKEIAVLLKTALVKLAGRRR